MDQAIERIDKVVSQSSPESVTRVILSSNFRSCRGDQDEMEENKTHHKARRVRQLRWVYQSSSIRDMVSRQLPI